MESWVDNNNNQFGTSATPGTDIVADTGNTSIPSGTNIPGAETFTATASAYSMTLQVTAATTKGATIALDNNGAISASPINLPSIATSQTPSIAFVGESIKDTATVTGLVSPSTGDTVTFNLYNASGTLLYGPDTETVSINGSTATAISQGYSAAATGTDYWVATFNGDTYNAAVTSGATAEPVNVDTITTSQTPAIAYVGESISDTATVTGLVSPLSTDTVTFNLYDNSTGSGTPLYTSSPVTVSISGSTATATSPGYTTTGVGTEYWVATFNGDTNNAAVTSGTAAETVNVDTITTSQTPAIAYVGESISDTATVTGLVNPSSSDTVTFNLYSNANGTGTPLYTSPPVTVSLSSTAARPRPRRQATPPPAWAPSTGWPPSTATPTTPLLPAAPPPRR